MKTRPWHKVSSDKLEELLIKLGPPGNKVSGLSTSRRLLNLNVTKKCEGYTGIELILKVTKELLNSCHM